MNHSGWRNRLGLVAAAFWASALASPELPAADATVVLVRPVGKGTVKDVDALRSALKMPAGNEVRLASIGARLWTVPQAEGEVRAALEKARPLVASEIVKGSFRDLVEPVDPKAAIPKGVGENLAKLKARDYARRIGVVRMRSPEFAAAYLVRGFGRENGMAWPASIRWKLFDNVSFTSTRVAWHAHDRQGTRLAWVGELDLPSRPPLPARYAKGFGAASYSKGNLYARFEHRGTIYQLVPLGLGYHAAIEVDPAKVPEDQPDKANIGDAGGDEPDKASIGDCGGDQPDRAGIGDTGGDQPDKATVGDTGGDQPDRASVGDTGGDQPDRASVGDAGGDQPDKATVGDAGGDQPDYAGFCPNACVPATTARGQRCNEGPRTCAVIRVGVAYTREAFLELPMTAPAALGIAGAAGMADAEHYAQYLVDLTSASFTRSGIHARIALGGVSIFNDLEPGDRNASRLLHSLLVPPAGSGFTAVHQWRDAIAADVVMMIARADRIPGVPFPAAGTSPSVKRVLHRNNAYSVVTGRYADAQLSFQHELGHQLGAGHDKEANTTPRFAWGQGFRNGCAWRTVMAYPPESGCRRGVPRYAMWSSCNLWVDGVLAGGPDMNNTRVINSLSGWVGNYRP